METYLWRENPNYCDHSWQFAQSTQYQWNDYRCDSVRKTIFGNTKYYDYPMSGRADEFYCSKCLAPRYRLRMTDVWNPEWWNPCIDTSSSGLGPRPEIMQHIVQWTDGETTEVLYEPPGETLK